MRESSCPAAERNSSSAGTRKSPLPGLRRVGTEHPFGFGKKTVFRQDRRVDTRRRQVALGGNGGKQIVILVTVLRQRLAYLPQVLLAGSHPGLKSCTVDGRNNQQRCDYQDHGSHAHVGPVPTTAGIRRGRPGSHRSRPGHPVLRVLNRGRQPSARIEDEIASPFGQPRWRDDLASCPAAGPCSRAGPGCGGPDARPADSPGPTPSGP